MFQLLLGGWGKNPSEKYMSSSTRMIYGKKHVPKHRHQLGNLSTTPRTIFSVVMIPSDARPGTERLPGQFPPGTGDWYTIENHHFDLLYLGISGASIKKNPLFNQPRGVGDIYASAIPRTPASLFVMFLVRNSDICGWTWPYMLVLEMFKATWKILNGFVQE